MTRDYGYWVENQLREKFGLEHKYADLIYDGLWFSPLKRARLDYMVQKAVEMGVSRLQPVMTRRTQAERVNLDRMRAQVASKAVEVEATRQTLVREQGLLGILMRLSR